MSTLENLLGWPSAMQRAWVSNRERRNARNDCEGEAALLRNPQHKAVMSRLDEVIKEALGSQQLAISNGKSSQGFS